MTLDIHHVKETLEKELYSLELHERQTYHYECDKTANNWNWTKEQEELFAKDRILTLIKIEKIKELLKFYE